MMVKENGISGLLGQHDPEAEVFASFFLKVQIGGWTVFYVIFTAITFAYFTTFTGAVIYNAYLALSGGLITQFISRPLHFRILGRMESNLKSFWVNLSVGLLIGLAWSWMIMFPTNFLDLRSDLSINTPPMNKFMVYESVMTIWTLLFLGYHFLYEKAHSLRVEQRLRYDLALRQKELISKATFLQQKNDLITSLKKEIEYRISLLETSEDRRQLKPILSSLNGALNAQSQWQEFEEQFVSVYPGFFRTLSRRFPKLTAADLKACAYLKMNQNTKEIAQLTGLSVRAVENRRYRLRQKMKLPKETDLSSFLNSVDYEETG